MEAAAARATRAMQRTGAAMAAMNTNRAATLFGKQYTTLLKPKLFFEFVRS